MTKPNEQLLEILGDLERSEARLLTWGVVDGAMSEDEVLDLIRNASARQRYDRDPEDTLDELLERHLLFEVPDRPGDFRTRTAETVRLSARLGQWRHGTTWPASPTLVADFRFDPPPQNYPRRTTEPQQAVKALA